ncbi:hypothetical protein AAZX31_08G133300 [Glycine max]
MESPSSMGISAFFNPTTYNFHHNPNKWFFRFWTTKF